jgi:hypothetical protein
MTSIAELLSKAYMKTLELSQLLHRHFGTDQSWHAAQQDDGTYRKKYGAPTTAFLKNNLDSSGSIAIYQKNIDQTIKWICFDFDIIKAVLDLHGFESAKSHLTKTVSIFCVELDRIGIPYLLEFSGNRGYHVWVTFAEPLPYKTGYEIQQAILGYIDIPFDKSIVGIDLFPTSATPTDGVGPAVKIPLSKHKKSKLFSLLIRPENLNEDSYYHEVLDKTIEDQQLTRLQEHNGITRTELENKLSNFFIVDEQDLESTSRVKNIKIEDGGFTINEMLTLWGKSPPLAALSTKISRGENLSNEQRKLIVGIFSNIVCPNRQNFATNLLHEIFKKNPNYDKTITERAINRLSSFYFPSQEQIEQATGIRFEKRLDIKELLSIAIPKFLEYWDASFDFCERDIETTSAGELNYLFLNDEAQSRVTINDLLNVSTEEKLQKVRALSNGSSFVKRYKHLRNEPNKVRTLYSLGMYERVFTSCILKQFVYFFDLKPNENSHGYQVNKGFKGGYIFQQWLFLWIRYIANVNTAIDDPDYQDFYIVKTDIKGFYDNIPHDSLKRLLLGGANSRIDARLKELPPQSAALYKQHLDALFAITENIIGGRRGLPQGPAYARYFAELYLDNIDQRFGQHISNGRLQLYQRYVDDIFFICATEVDAQDILRQLEEDLKLLGLEINSEKTRVSRIKNFASEFEAYKSQSKYVVDQASKDFDQASENQQNTAITEFMRLLASESCSDDLSFVYSHLSGVVDLDNWKREKFLPVINSKLGRGTLFKHMFSFAMEDEKNWPILFSIELLDALQSEVFTATLLGILQLQKEKTERLLELAKQMLPKLTMNQLVCEHIALLILLYKLDVSLDLIEPEIFITCARSLAASDKIYVTAEIFARINTALNDIDSIQDFVNAIFPFCASVHNDAYTLNELASVFYSKISLDESRGYLSSERPVEITSGVVAQKLYYLVCLFCVSDKNSSTKLLRSIWKYCIRVVNENEDIPIFPPPPNWYTKISFIKIDHTKAYFLISAIVDDAINRGTTDKRNIFEKFHNIFLLFIAFQNPNIDSERIKEYLETLRTKGKFYEWLLDRENVRLFPQNVLWFERNVVDNSLIALRKNAEVLFRRPTADFHHASFPQNEHNGYSEVLIPYVATNYISLKDALDGLNVRERMRALIQILEYCSDKEIYPNIFCNERLIDPSDLKPFCSEMWWARSLILEDYNGNISSTQNNAKNFVKNFFNAFSTNENFVYFKEKYIDQLDQETDIVEFTRTFYNQLESINGNEAPYYYDLAFASALFISLGHLSSFKRIDKFVEIYHRFNPLDQERHVYTVKKTVPINEETPLALLNSVEESLKLLISEATPSLGLYLYQDVEKYKHTLMRIASSSEALDKPLNLEEFTLSDLKFLQTTDSVRVGRRTYEFKNTFIFHVWDGDLNVFARMNTVISASTHVYVCERDNKLFILAIEEQLSKVATSLVQRTKDCLNVKKIETSYPISISEPYDVAELINFPLAIQNIASHIGSSTKEANTTLTKWLRSVPKSFHQNLVTLLAAHKTISRPDINKFIAAVAQLMTDKEANPFLIKVIADYNGTHRLLYQDHDLGRSVESLSPINFKADSNSATLIADIIITGSQIISALKYYTTREVPKGKPNYFAMSEKEAETLSTRLSQLKILNLCVVFFTAQALKNITQACKEFLNPEIEVRIYSGKDIGEDAFFGSSTLIGDAEKYRIRQMLKDPSQMASLMNNLQSGRQKLKFKSDDDIDKYNLVARYQSLPKKCFSFLHMGLRFDEECHPFTRISEPNEPK